MMRRAAWLVGITLASTSACTVTPTGPGRAPIVASEVPPPSGPPSEFFLTMLDVGTGLSVLVRGSDFTLLYDAGSQDDRGGEDETRVAAYLVEILGPSGPAGCGGNTEAHPPRVLSHVFLSHPHLDHLSLFPEVFRCFGVAHVWDSGYPGKSAAYRAFLDDAARSGAKLHRPRSRRAASDVSSAGAPALPFARDTRVALGRDASFTVLHVDPDASDENEASIVLQLRLGTKTILLMGDAEGGERRAPDEDTPPSPKSVEGQLLARYGAALDADVLVVGHHGSMTSSRLPFLDRVSPEIALISSGPFPYKKVRLPDPEVVGALAARARVYRTDVDDDACRLAPRKVGRDADGKPGGCSAITLRFAGDRIDVDSGARP